MKAIVLLCLRPHERQVSFYSGFAARGYDVYLVIDDNAWQGPLPAGVRRVQIDDALCAAQGFHGLNPEVKKPSGCSAWDKAVCHFSRDGTAYDAVWLIEDDVFVPSLDTIEAIDRRHGAADVVSASHSVNRSGELLSWEWWQYVPRRVLPLPWAASMVCAVRVSGPLLGHVGQLLRTRRAAIRDAGWARKWLYRASRYLLPELARRYLQYRRYPFIEFLFHTVAVHHGMAVVAAEELRGIVWRQDWQAADMHPRGLYHPVKDRDLHDTLRSQLRALHPGPAGGATG